MGSGGEPGTAGPRRGDLPALIRGAGPPLVLCPGFALHPRTYTRTVDLLARHATVVVPDLFAVAGRWDYPDVLAALERLLDRLGTGPVTMLGHSFGGGIALGFTARRPEQVKTLVLCNSLGVSERWELAREAVLGTNFARLATLGATRDFFRSLGTHPARVAGAGWWAFRVDKSAEIEAVRAAAVARHVVWTARDTLLSPAGGERFAHRLRASFTLVAHGGSRPVVDHDWVYRRPELVPDTLRRIGVVPAEPQRAGA